MTVTQTGLEKRGSDLRRLWENMSIIFRSRVAVIGMALVLFWVVVAIFAPLIAPHDPLAQNSKAINQGPSQVYPLGTDKLGRDVLSRLIYGARTILVLAPISVLVSVTVGTCLGQIGRAHV